MALDQMERYLRVHNGISLLTSTRHVLGLGPGGREIERFQQKFPDL